MEKASLYLTGVETMQLKSATVMFWHVGIRTLFNFLMFVQSLPAGRATLDKASPLLFFDVDFAFLQTIC